MQLLLVLFFFPLLPRFFFLSFLFLPPFRFENYIYRNGVGFLLDWILYLFLIALISVRVRFFVEKRSICGKIFFEGSLVRSSVSNISIRSEIVIAEFFLITDNLARYNGKLNLTSRNTSNYSILKILEFESISNVPFINSIEFEIFSDGFFSLEKILA